jgi:hypothetical protein
MSGREVSFPSSAQRQKIDVIIEFFECKCADAGTADIELF